MRSSAIQKRIVFFGALLAFLLFSIHSAAQTLPQILNLSGGLFNPNGTAIVASNVAFKLELLDKAGVCVLYSEEHLAQDLSATKGAFSVQLGSGTAAANNLQGGAAFTYGLFLNNGATGAFTGCAPGVTLAPGDERLIRVSYNLGAGYVAMSPNVPIVSSAFAMVADTLQGKLPGDFVQINNVSAGLSQSNVETIFSNLNYPKLLALINGSSTQYLPTTPTVPVDLNNQRIVNVLNPTGAQDAATKNYSDNNLGGNTLDSSGVGLGVGGGKTLVWDQILNKWVAQTPSAYVTGVVAGSGLIGGTVSSYGTLSVDTGTTANQIVQLTNLAYLPAVDAHLLTNIQFPVVSVNGKTGVVTLVPSDISGFGTAALKDYGTAAGNLVELAGASRLPALDGFALSNLNAIYLQSRLIASVAPTTGQILTWNGSQWEPQAAPVSGITDLYGDVVATGPGNVNATIVNDKVTSAKINSSGNVANRILITDATTGATVTYATCLTGEILKYSVATGWGCAPDAGAAGSVTLVAAGAGLVAGTISSVGTLSVDVGVGANKIVQLTAGAQYPAVDGNLITNVNAVKLQARDVASTAPGAGQFLGYNATTSAWEPMTGNSGSLTGVVSGTGLVAGTVSSYGTINIDVGSTANKIVQLTGGAQYPQADGYLITNINSASISGVGTVTSVNSGTGLLGGPFSTIGTLSVDVGTAANKILQLNGSAQIPAVDGNLVTNVNAVKLQARDVASTAPGAGQFLGYNATTSAWEPMTGNSGSLTGVVSGTGLVAGTVSSYGTINIDVGSTANKIVQLTAGAQYPQADGYLITNINAGSISGVGTVTSVNSGTGLLGGPFSTVGTLSVDVGTTANKIVQVTAGGQYPAVDGNLVTNVNAVKLQTRDVAVTAPGDGQVLTWNNAALAWEPKAPGAGADNLGNHTASQNLAMANFSVVGLNLGTAGAPSVSFNSDATTGVFSPAASTVAISTGGGERLRVTSTGALGVGTNTPARRLHISGTDGMRLDPTALPGSPAAGDIAIDSGASNTLKYYNGSAWISSSGTMTGVVSGTGLVAGTVSSYGTINIDVGSTANKIVQLTAGAQYPQADGYLITNINSASISGVGTVTSVNSGTGLLGGPFSTVGTLSVDVGTTANKIIQVTAGGQYPAVDGNLITNVNAVKLQARDVASTAPGAGQFLGYNATTSVWEPMSGNSGSLTGVVSGTGLVAGTVSSYGTINIDVGSTANKIVQITSGGQYPGADAYMLTNLNVVTLRNRVLASTAPTNGQVIGWNSTTSVWEPISSPVGSMTGVVAGAGLVPSTLTGYGTLNVDVGTTANKVLQLTGSAQIPAVDGSLISNINAVKIQGRAVTVVAPAANQVLTWNGSQWEPQNAQASSNAFVNGGNAFGATASLGTTDVTNLNLLTCNNVQVTITSGGNVGIGTTSPASKLHVANGDITLQAGERIENSSDAITFSGTRNLSIDLNASSGYPHLSTSASKIVTLNPFSIATSGANYLHFQQTGVAHRGAIGFAAGSGDLTYRAGAQDFTDGTEVFRITSVGRVGIGTTSPQAILDVRGTGTLQSAMLVPRDSTANRPAGVNGMIRYNSQTNKMETFENGGWANLATGTGVGDFKADGSVPMTGNLNAFVGSAALPGVSFAGDTDTGMFEPGANTLGFSTGGSQRLTIDSSGNVGIGSSLPTKMLDVGGDAKINSVTVGLGNNSVSTNLAVGAQALNFNSSGTANSAFGYRALYLTSTGGSNTGVGYEALYTNGGGGSNTAVGYAALFTNSASDYNTAIGTESLNLATGARNTGIGYRAGSQITTGANNVVIGSNTGSSIASLNNHILISDGSGTERIRIDSSGNVGIGTTGASKNLSFAGLTNQSVGMERSTSNGGGNLTINAAGAQAGSIDKAGGNLYLSSGVSTGGGQSTIFFQTPAFWGSPGTSTDSTMQNKMIISSQGIGIGSVDPYYNFEINSGGSGGPALMTKNSQNTAGTVGSGHGGTIGVLHARSSGGSPLQNGDMAGEFQFYGSNTSWTHTLVADMASQMTNVNAGAEAGNLQFATKTGGVLGVRMFIDPTGLIGIGTTSPQAILDVRGTGALQSAMIVPRDNTANRPTGVNGMLRYNSETNKMETFENGAWANLATGTGVGDFKADGSVPMTGNLNAFKGSAALPGVSFAGDTDTGMFEPGANTLGFSTNGLQRVTIDSSGNVGIGTTSPDADAKLSVYDSSNSSILRVASDGSAQAARIDLKGPIDGYSILNFNTTASIPTTGTWQFLTRNISNGTLPQTLQIRYVDSVTPANTFTAAIFKNDGSVGIGTTSPQAILDVRGTGALQSAMIVPRDSSANRPTGVNGMIRYNSETNRMEAFENGAWTNATASGASGFVNGGNAFGSTASLGTTDVTNLNLLTCNNVKVTITSGGNVGIGTTAPAELLSLRKDGGDAALSLSAFENGIYSNFLEFSKARGTAATPLAAISGDRMATINFNAYDGSAFVPGAGIQARVDGTPGVGDMPGRLDFYTTPDGASSGTARVSILNDGNVGIGTTAPTVLLELQKNQNAGTGIIIGNSTSGTAATSGMSFAASASTGTIAQLSTGFTPSGMKKADGFLIEAGGAGTGLTLNTAGADPIEFGTNNVLRMLIDQLGNVGIGSSSPRVALDVNGAIASKPAVNVTGATADFVSNNIAYTAQNCGTFALWNLKDGATYTFAVQGTSSTTCIFNAFSGAGSGALTVKMPPGHGATTATFQTLYSFLVAGSTVYVSWIPGY